MTVRIVTAAGNDYYCHREGLKEEGGRRTRNIK